MFSDTITLGNVVVVAALVLMAGAVAGQFRRGVVSELRASLDTASSEIEIQRQRGDRLELEMSRLSAENAGLHAEIKTLRDVLVTGGHLQVAITDAVNDAMGRAVSRIVESQTTLAGKLTEQIVGGK